MFAKISLATSLVLAGLPKTVGYPAIGAYMPVTNVREQMQVSLDVSAFGEALAGENPNYALAKDIYEQGAGNSCKSPTQARTLQGFAVKDLTGETYYDKFIAAGLAKSFWDQWFQAALAGTGKFAGLSRVKRVTCLKKFALGLVQFYASHELESALNKAKDNATLDDAAHAWDEGWAFYYGANATGKDAPYKVAAEYDGDFPQGTEVKTQIVTQFNKGQYAVTRGTYDAAMANEATNTIYQMWAISCLRAALKYLELAENAYDEKAHSEGYAHYMSVDGWLYSKSVQAATTLRAKLAIEQASIPAGSFCAAKAALEASYPALGVDCSILGTFEGQVITSCASCTAATVSIPQGRATAATMVDATYGTDMECKVVKMEETASSAVGRISFGFRCLAVMAVSSELAVFVFGA